MKAKAKEFNIRHTDGKTRKFTEGENCKAMGTSGMTDGVEVEGTLTTGNFKEFCLINKRGIPCSVNDRTLVKVEEQPKKDWSKEVDELISKMKLKGYNEFSLLGSCKLQIKEIESHTEVDEDKLGFFTALEDKLVKETLVKEMLKAWK